MRPSEALWCNRKDADSIDPQGPLRPRVCAPYTEAERPDSSSAPRWPALESDVAKVLLRIRRIEHREAKVFPLRPNVEAPLSEAPDACKAKEM